MYSCHVAGSVTVHLAVKRESGDVWTHVPGFTFCGMEPVERVEPGTVRFLCRACDAWLQEINEIARGAPRQA